MMPLLPGTMKAAFHCLRRLALPCILAAGLPAAALPLTASPSAAASAVGAPVTVHRHYGIAATLESKEHRITGTVTVHLTNNSSVALHEAVFVLFANRFASPDERVDDFN